MLIRTFIISGMKNNIMISYFHFHSNKTLRTLIISGITKLPILVSICKILLDTGELILKAPEYKKRLEKDNMYIWQIR